MTAFDNGGPAYQITANNSVYASGMSLWDAAALAAIQGNCASLTEGAGWQPESLVENAAAMADAAHRRAPQADGGRVQ
jgi:hypothetical protein